jgi:peptidoglycan/xylan/chitin deacetylase (PgdA/CDA1 family)
VKPPLVLLYHAVCPPPSSPVGVERRLFLDPERFAQQIEDLDRRGFRTLTLSEYAVGLKTHAFAERTVLLTFDDAYAHIDEVVTPVLRRHGFHAVMFAPVGHLGGRNTWDAPGSANLARLQIASPSELRTLDPQVWDVASHGLRHIDLRRVSSGERRTELVAAREVLSHVLGRPVLDLAYPYGAGDASVRRDAERAGYRMAFVAADARVVDQFQLPRRPISGEDSIQMFRFKTSTWSSPFYRAYESSPRWFRRPASAVLRLAALN